MRGAIIFVISLLISCSSMQAQVVPRGARVMRSGTQASASSQRIARQLEQQSRRAEQAARAATATSRLKIRPSGVPIVAPNLDTDDNNRKKGGNTNGKLAGVKPIAIPVAKLAKIKTLTEYEDEHIAAQYDSIKALVYQDNYNWLRYSQFQLADYAMRHDDEQFAISCLESVNTEHITPKYLEIVTRRYPSLNEYIPEISRAVTICAYLKMLEAKLNGFDCESARMKNGDTLLIVTNQFNPALNPLVVLSCFYDSTKEVDRYKEAADSVIATYDQWIPEFKDTFARHFLMTLIDSGESDVALDYFGRMPLKEFPERNIDFAIDLADCAIAERDAALFSEYLQQAVALDSVAAEEYWAELYKGNWEKYLTDPSQLALADWLVEMSPEPTNNALLLSVDLLERLNGTAEISWEWVDIADYTPEQATYRTGILHIVDKGLAVDDDSLSNPDAAEWCQYIKAVMLLLDSTTLEYGKAMLNGLSESNNIELRCNAIISLAYISAHGLDKPKDGLKILKKNIKSLDNPPVNSDIRNTWYDYMASLATRLGKTKDAEKYRKFKDTTNAE